MIKLKVLIAFITTFTFISGLGLFCAAAGGIQWGTSSAGFASTMTLVAAMGLGTIVAVAVIPDTDRLE